MQGTLGDADISITCPLMLHHQALDQLLGQLLPWGGSLYPGVVVCLLAM